ncbi:MAG: hypothetical protein KDB60_14725 [Propionibacteriaceae bacterium]|nr:hypothetical protein [Propionibacteriaceae bacterium]
MLSDEKQAEVLDFLTQVAGLGVEDYTAIDKHALDAFEVCDSAYPLLKLAAADFSWLEKRCRDTAGRVRVKYEWPDLGVSSGVVGLTVSAAQAIVRRDRLSAEQYEGYVGGFRQVGVTLPDHPGAP